ncbi:MAG: zinc ABC transporter substrate-binding protein [Sphaerochaetaceae bacterium]
MKKTVVLVMLFLILALSLFAKGEKETTTAKPIVAVSIQPQQFVVDKIGGDLVETLLLVGPGQNPHSYEPTPRQMANLSNAKVWILSQTDFELALVPKIKALYPNLLLVDGTEGVKFRYLEEHSHNEDEHSHHLMELDRHTWMGKEPMKILAKQTANALISIDESNREIYLRNLEIYLDEIDSLFTLLSEEMNQLSNSTVLVYHPSFGYLLDDFNIEQKAIEVGGKEPTPKALNELIKFAKESEIKTLFVQAQFPSTAAKNVADAIGGAVIPLDPLAYDWIENIKLIAKTLHQYHKE